jgi:LysR family hydrogen peroxide-inducible transcriptional activator
MNDVHPDARHLRCFVAAAEAESLRGAARRLGLAQATVTEHIRRLESLLGFRVFDRVGRSIVLTEQGRLLLPRARAAVRAVEGVAAGIADAVEAGAGRLAVGAIPTMSPYLLPPVISALRSEYPDCEIVVVEDLTESLLERLDDHSIDAAVLSPPVDHPRVEVETLGTERMIVVAPESGGSVPAGEVTLRELRSFPRVSLSEIHCLGDQIESFCTKRDLSRQVSCHATQLDTVFELVRLGLGVSLVPSMAAQERRRDGLRYLRLRRDSPRRAIGIAKKSGRSSSLLADRFAALLELEIRERCDG